MISSGPLTSVDDLQRVMVLSRPSAIQLEVYRDRRPQQLSVLPRQTGVKPSA